MQNLQVGFGILCALCFFLTGGCRALGAEPPADRDRKESTNESEEFEALIRQYEKAPETWPKDKLLSVGAAYRALEKYDKAEPILKKVLEGNPEEPDALAWLSAIERVRGNEDEGLRLARKAASLGQPIAATVVIADHLRRKEFEQAKAHVPTLLKRKDERPEFALTLIFYALSVKPPDHELFLKVADDLDDLYILGDSFWTQHVINGLERYGRTNRAATLKSYLEQLKNADQVLREYVVKDPAQLSAFRKEIEIEAKKLGLPAELLLTALVLPVLKATPEQMLVNLDKSAALYEKQPELFSEKFLLLLGAGCLNQKEYDRAEQFYEQYLKSHPNDVGALRRLALACYHQKKQEKFLDASRRAWALGDEDALRDLANTYTQVKQFDKLGDLVPDLLKIKPRPGDVVCALVTHALESAPPKRQLVLDALEGADVDAIIDFPAAVMIVAKAGEILGDAEKIPKSLWLTFAVCLASARQLDKAEPLYRRILEGDPDNKRALRGLGVIEASRGNDKKAIDLARRAWALGDVPSLKLLAGMYLSEEDTELFRELTPAMIKHREDDAEFIALICLFALRRQPVDRELFYRAIDGATDETILKESSVGELVIKGLEEFDDHVRAVKLKTMLDVKKAQAASPDDVSRDK